MKYWGYLAAKIAAAAALLFALGAVLRWAMPARAPASYPDVQQRMWHDFGYALCLYGFWLIGVGVFYLVFLDQKYRCRTCLRRLRMPIARGSWSRLFLGRPHMEYICPFGHGTLKVSQVHLTGKEPNHWAEHQDIWTELELLDTEKR